MNSKNFITIQGWMISELNLKGNDLLIYAIIYGFSQCEGQYFTGSLSYLAEWTNSSKQGVQKNLKNLIDKGLIKKLTINEQIVYTTELSIDSPSVQLSCTNNIDNNNSTNNFNNSNNINNNDIRSKKKEEEDFLGTLNKEDKPKKKNKYEQCVDLIHDRTEDPKLIELLQTYLRMRLEMTNAPIYVNQWKGLLNELERLAHSSQEAYDIVQQSINRVYRGFYPVSEYKNNTGFKEVISKPTAEAENIQKSGRDISGAKF